MRTQLATWHTSLWAALGLAAVSCGGKSDAAPSTVEGGGAGGTGAETGTGGRTFVDFGGASGFGGTGNTSGAGGFAGSAGTGGTSGVAGTGDTGGTNGATTTGGTGGTGIDLRCSNPRPVIGITGLPTGFVECDGGWLHRPEQRECASIVPRPGEVAPRMDAGTGCTRDDECSHLPRGYCAFSPGDMVSRASSSCVSGCVRDEDCGPDLYCSCGNPIGSCVRASCRTDADCGTDLLCSASPRVSGCGHTAPGDLACQQRTDACSSRQDCVTNTIGGSNCVPAPTGRQCQNAGLCGRPFLVEGAPRLAPLVARPADWSGPASAISTLELPTRAKLAEHWSNNGLMEHASVAAFARFALQLLSLGAPAELIDSAQKALGDEIAHTKLCFALASHYAGRPLGPGPLPMNGALENDSFFDIVSTAITEACIGETLAAVEAAEAATYAQDRRVREALETIARDEAQHAELGWKFLGWALDAADGETRARLITHLRRQVEHEIAHSSDDTPEFGDAATVLEHGVLTGFLRREVRRTTLTALLAPIGQALAEGPERLVA